MRLIAILVAAISVAAAPSSTAPPNSAPGVASAALVAKGLPPGEEGAKAALEVSPRHGEFVDVKLPSGVAIRTWVVYPERKDKAGVVLLIHEIYGLSDWMRGVADQLAADGFIAVAPDLISGFGPGGGGTDSVPSRDDVVKLVRALTPEEARARLQAVRAYAEKLPAANGKLATMGFCWGGGQSFAFAAATPPPNAAVVFYGTAPDSATLLEVRAPVLGLYGEDDARVNATIAPARAALSRLRRAYETHVFPGAGHGFLRAQGLRDGANLAAARKAWPLAVGLLRKRLE